MRPIMREKTFRHRVQASSPGVKPLSLLSGAGIALSDDMSRGVKGNFGWRSDTVIKAGKFSNAQAYEPQYRTTHITRNSILDKLGTEIARNDFVISPAMQIE